MGTQNPKKIDDEWVDIDSKFPKYTPDKFNTRVKKLILLRCIPKIRINYLIVN